jgi:hypothetical protein
MMLFLQTLSGECSVGEACAALGICESRFYEQRGQWLQASLELLEPRLPGRPPKAGSPVASEEVRDLRTRVRELEAQAAALEVQAELACSLPHVVHRPRPGKKTTSLTARRASRSMPN